MKIRFGMGLDGQCSWSGADRLGEPTVGPLGMLGILETQLGLLRVSPTPAERIVQYRAFLARANPATRFYGKSFEADELGVAATLLSWRDQWHLWGWSGVFPAGATPRLKDMADVERLAAGTVAPSIGERLKLVEEAMGRATLPIESITLTDPLETYPERWRRILVALPVKPHQEVKVPEASAGTLLAGLQERLVNSRVGTKPLPWIDDGSITIAQGETRLLSGRWLCEIAKGLSSGGLLIAGPDALLLDELAEHSGNPRHGFAEVSSFRPPLQVLPLAFATLWKPLDVKALLQFLTHPVCPVRRRAARLLAAELADQPGVGSVAWDTALAQIREKEGERADEVLQSISRWVDHERFDRAVGAPVAVIIERAAALEKFFQSRLGIEDRGLAALFRAAHSQVRACRNALQHLSEQGAAVIRPYQLQQLVTQVTARGTENAALYRQMGSLLHADDPAAVIEPTDTVIWWQMSAPPMPRTHPWSKSELADLAKAGISAPDPASELARRGYEWLRPIAAARKRLVLVLPPEGEELHPVWLHLKALLADAPITQLDHLLSSVGERDGIESVPIRPLPERKRWWSLPDNAAIPIGDRFSYSGLNLVLNDPYEWVLKYPARLTPSRVLSVSDGPLLFGNLSHSLAEHFFSTPEVLQFSARDVDVWFAREFDVMVAKSAAVLLSRGRRADLEQLRDRLGHALHSLMEQFKASGVVSVQPERELGGPFAGGKISGFADLVVRKESGATAIVDMKWGNANFHRSVLASNAHLQLGVYAALLRDADGGWPEVAYFVISTAQLFARTQEFFSKAQLAGAGSPEGTPDLWRRFECSWRWRQCQLKSGRVEVVMSGTEPTEDSQSPMDGLAPQPMNEDYNEYVGLAGWEPHR